MRCTSHTGRHGRRASSADSGAGRGLGPRRQLLRRRGGGGEVVGPDGAADEVHVVVPLGSLEVEADGGADGADDEVTDVVEGEVEGGLAGDGQQAVADGDAAAGLGGLSRHEGDHDGVVRVRFHVQHDAHAFRRLPPRPRRTGRAVSTGRAGAGAGEEGDGAWMRKARAVT